MERSAIRGLSDATNPGSGLQPPSNRELGSTTRDLFASWFPRVLSPLVRISIYAMLDEAVLKAFGFPSPPHWFRRVVAGCVKLRGRVVRYLPPRKTAHFFSHDKNRSHPHGYRIDEIGPPDFLARIHRKGSGDGPA